VRVNDFETDFRRCVIASFVAHGTTCIDCRATQSRH
jgi:hypothetical protein